MSSKAGSALAQMYILIGNQVISRLLTFGLNVLVVRQVGSVVFGLSAVNLYLIYTVILSISREGLRKVSLRGKNESSDEQAEVEARTDRARMTGEVDELYNARVRSMNLAWLSFPIALITAMIMVTFYIRFPPLIDSLNGRTGAAPSSPPESIVLECTLREWTIAVVIYASSALLEIFAEPLYQHAYRHIFVYDMTGRVYAETMANLGRCITTWLCVQYLDAHLLSFAYGQLVYSLLYSCRYYHMFLRETRYWSSLGTKPYHQRIEYFENIVDLFPHRATQVTATNQALHSTKSQYFDPAQLQLGQDFTVQSIEKLVLTEGEKVVIVALSTELRDQGAYSLVQNIGSLVARFLFQPLEEIALAEFCALTKAQATVESIGNDMDTSVNVPHQSACTVPTQSTNNLRTLLVDLLKVVIYVGLLFASFGPNYSFIFLHLIYGAKWSMASSAPSALSWFCLYILVMAVNGITEAFVFATISSGNLLWYNRILWAFSVVYLLSCCFLIRYGSVGLIAANCVGMTARILYSTVYIDRFFGSLFAPLIKEVTPPSLVCLSFLSSHVILYVTSLYFNIFSEVNPTRWMAHIGIGVALLFGTVYLIFTEEKQFIERMKQTLLNKKAK